MNLEIALVIVAALGLLIYLAYSMLAPEKF
jgi:K+-transporting ATPase KdpF subunit